MPSLDAVTLIELQRMLHITNPYVHVFQQTGSILLQNPSQHLTMIIKDSRAADSCQYNLPCALEIAAIIVGEPNNETEICNRDIIIRSYEGGLQRITELHRAYVPLHYVLLFPRSEDRWHLQIPLRHITDLLQSPIEDDPNTYDENDELDNEVDVRTRKYVTMMQYYSYSKSNYIKLPDHIYVSSKNLLELIDFIYPNITLNSTNSNYFLERGILAPKNIDVSFINSTIMT
ncbi:5861_t:CDS:2, partial [Racocetra fulgida]